MARAKASKGKAHVVANPVDPAAEIRGFHALGKLVLARAARDGSSISSAAREVAEAKGASCDRARTAARFAGLFDEIALDRLCALRGMPLTVDHVRKVLRLKGRAVRRKWLERAAKEHWPAGRLDRELRRALGGAAGKGGPRLKPTDDPAEALEQVLSWTEGWLLRYEKLWQDDHAWPVGAGPYDTDQAELITQLRQAKKRLERLGVSARTLAGRFEALARKMRRKVKSTGGDRAARTRDQGAGGKKARPG
jgi:hypothetical protein